MSVGDVTCLARAFFGSAIFALGVLSIAVIGVSAVLAQFQLCSRQIIRFGLSSSLVLYVHRNHKAYWGRATVEEEGGKVRIYTYRYSVAIRMTHALRWAG